MAPGPGPIPSAATPRPSSNSRAVRRSVVATGQDSTEGNMERRASLPAAALQDEVAWRVVCELKDFIMKKEGSVLRAWCRHFDTASEEKISLSEFLRGMRKMDYQGDAKSMFETLDADLSGELALEEIDANASDQWRRFRAFCVQNFEDAPDMVRKLGRQEVAEVKRGAGPKVIQGGPATWSITQESFTDGLRNLGWTNMYEHILFSALNTNDKAAINEDDLKWLEMEQRRQKRKELAKKKALMEMKRSTNGNWKVAEAVLEDFKQFLKKKYGNYVKAWLSALSADGSMVLQRNVLFKACANIGWHGDVRLLFKAFDKDDSGYISIEELDAHAAEILARFREFIESQFGNATAAFHALDRFNQKKLKQPEFLSALKSFGFQHPAKVIFQGLDHRGAKYLVVDDLLFLDRWKPPAFLTRPANPQAMEDMKAALIKKYKNYLKAWRHCLDVDSSNRCTYDEFEAACKTLNFKGDVPGAWRALDEDLSGYITLHEIDSVSSSELGSFRRWCDEEFGSVRSAFGVFDNSADDEVSYREWRRSLRIYGFEGNASSLFYALDVEKNGSLSLDEVVFLDDWSFPAVGGEASKEDLPSPEDLGLMPRQTTDLTTQYVTDGPGPGAYRNASTLGCGPLMPMVHFSGAYSFRKRTQETALLALSRDAAGKPSPGDYDDLRALEHICPNKPCWAFGTEPRRIVEPRDPESMVPGPGQYTPLQDRGPAAACTPRRPLKVHPLFRDIGLPREVSRSPRKDMVAPLPRI
eukprot:gb/GFBE01005995.1/.p1 GENE.gb/GFBE01005995.1/~~gb/GFBE01005995.1/.p1  ORF type:complete len:755 (+),score=188.70 gb/GFBE01005995.1/:1-2265(+)